MYFLTIIFHDDFFNKQYALGVFVDLSKAFDTADHKFFISKLENFGIRGKNILWFISYLTNRTQLIKYNNLNTSFQKIVCDFPKGSVLDLYCFSFT